VPASYEYESFIRESKSEKMEKDSELYKVVAEVFDKSTLMTLYHLINKGVLNELCGVVSTGKEANVFLALDRGGNPLALKIYRIATSDFRTMFRYLVGDPRFRSIRKDRRHVVYEWASREYKNLLRASEAGIPAPKPICVKNNVLAMEFLGEGNRPYPRMRDHPPENPKGTFKKLFSSVRALYQKARLVHSDLSEYNVLLTPEPVLIDFSMATDIANPMAEEWLRRDVSNLVKYFRKFNVPTPDPEELIAEIRGERGSSSETAEART